MKQLIFIVIFSQSYFIMDAQVCFTYDNAGNRIKRQTCILAMTNQENEELSHISPELSIESRSLSEDNDLSELVVYPNPTSSTIQLKNQMEWFGAILKVVTNDGKVVNNITINDGPIDMSHLPSGSYFLILANEINKKTAKLYITK